MVKEDQEQIKWKLKNFCERNGLILSSLKLKLKSVSWIHILNIFLLELFIKLVK